MQCPVFRLPSRSLRLAVVLGMALLIVCGADLTHAAAHGGGIATDGDAAAAAWFAEGGADRSAVTWDALNDRGNETWCSEDPSSPALTVEPTAVNADAPFLGTCARLESAFAGVAPFSSAGPSGNAPSSSPSSAPLGIGGVVVKGSSLLTPPAATHGPARPANPPGSDSRVPGTLQTVPEPSSILLGAVGLTVVVITRRRRR